MRASTVSLVRRVFSPFFAKKRGLDVSDLLLTPREAVSELKRRASDKELRARVRTYLKNDIPPYFKREPVLYTARYIASPNFETLRFIEMSRSFGLKTVITQDTHDIFAPQNEVKKALCKMPICLRITHKEGGFHEHFKKVAIVDINASAGKPLHEIKTLWGEPLVAFHTRLFPKGTKVNIHDDTAWIDRNGRGDLLELYKRYLALFVAHGALFEDYVMADAYEAEFVRSVVRPAFRFVEEQFGYKPLIAYSVPNSQHSSLYWLSYPGSTSDILREKMRGLHPRKETPKR